MGNIGFMIGKGVWWKKRDYNGNYRDYNGDLITHQQISTLNGVGLDHQYWWLTNNTWKYMEMMLFKPLAKIGVLCTNCQQFFGGTNRQREPCGWSMQMNQAQWRFARDLGTDQRKTIRCSQPISRLVVLTIKYLGSISLFYGKMWSFTSNYQLLMEKMWNFTGTIGISPWNSGICHKEGGKQRYGTSMDWFTGNSCDDWGNEPWKMEMWIWVYTIRYWPNRQFQHSSLMIFTHIISNILLLC